MLIFSDDLSFRDNLNSPADYFNVFILWGMMVFRNESVMNGWTVMVIKVMIRSMLRPPKLNFTHRCECGLLLFTFF